MRVPFAYLTDQFANPEPIFDRLRAFLKRCDFTLGEDVEEFEKKYAQVTGSRFAIGVGSGTDALALSLKALGVGPGDEVITAANTFHATLGAIVQVGAIPRLADVGPDLLIDPEAIGRAITQKTAAVMPVHWAGAPAAMERILEVVRPHRLPVVEDACQALGAKTGGRSVGSWGITGAFSVHPLKPLLVWGDGGVIVTNDEKVAQDLRRRRNHGLVDRDRLAFFGVNSRLDTLQAIVGNYVFESLHETLGKRTACAQQLDREFRDPRWEPFVELPARPQGTHSFHLYQLFAKNRDELLKCLQAAGIEAKVHYPIPLHLQEACLPFGYRLGDFPMSERQAFESITLPCHQFLTSAQVDYQLGKIAEFYGVKRA